MKLRRGVIQLAIAAMLLTFDFPVSAQQPSKAIKIGELVFRGSVGSNLGEGRRLFRRARHDLGYIEGKNIFFEIRSAEGKLDRLPALAEEWPIRF